MQQQLAVSERNRQQASKEAGEARRAAEEARRGVEAERERAAAEAGRLEARVKAAAEQEAALRRSLTAKQEELDRLARDGEEVHGGRVDVGTPERAGAQP